ncbi:hypothetical protein BDF20DRAFT_916516 [Mycotypha africana]|uniref:uncharacterized protein n=1 Tax=Mycotypha africana TaxID=64632 RepID=UPI0023012239|nr:uncharacterized protein BDF20DRAFT_916516 [Mycotypha africana]KAI8969127.1 hypothetical protein BDF20DRAFT_916516 [Mycotypha africana]
MMDSDKGPQENINRSNTADSSNLASYKSYKPIQLSDGVYATLDSPSADVSTLKRTDSDNNDKQPSLVRGYSTRSSRLIRPSETNSIHEPSTPLFRAATTGNVRLSSQSFSVTDANKSGNPFVDPIWSKNNFSYDSLGARGSLNSSINMSRMGLSDGRRTTDFIDTSSTEYLIAKRSPNSPNSYGPDEKNASEKVTENTCLNNYFNEDIAALEEGEGPTKEKKKKKKKKDKNAGGATVEPKVFFANERTYMQWLNFAAILLTLAITLINFGDRINTIVGGIFFGIAIVFALYSFGFSRWRAWRITHKPHLRFDDIFGPVFLCIFLVGCLVLNAVLRYNHPSPTTGYLGTNKTQTEDDSGL